MSWSYWFCDTITGEKLQQVYPSAGSWSRALNQAQSGSHTFPLGEPVLTREVWRDITASWSRTFVQCWDDEPVYAGVVTGQPYDRDRRMLTVNHSDIRCMFLDRYPFGEDGYWENEGAGIPGEFAVSGVSPVSAAGLAVQAGLTAASTAIADCTLPIVLPSLVESGTFSATYANYTFQNVSDILDEIQEMDGGPDIEFAPRWSGSDTLEWVMRAGALDGGDFEFDLTAPDCPVSSVKVRSDGLKQVTGVFGVGAGFGPSMIVGGQGAGAPTATIPSRDDVVVWKMVQTIPQVAALAVERIAAFNSPTVQPTFVVQADEVSPLDLILGSTVATVDSGDPFLPDGTSECRLIGLSGGVGSGLTLTVQEVRA